MHDPIIVPRQDHTISRRNVDPEALKVLYRLHEHHYTAYLVGGSVRDLLLGRRPKDFDIGTDAHPYQIKKLFRNCWIIGRRFRLAHIKFGPKTIEVATFRKNVPDPQPDAPETEAADLAAAAAGASGHLASPEAGAEPGMIHRDNTFGTPEEDAFRRDFTINGLFYDIGTFSVIDYVGGLKDLERRVIRSIGDPRVRFVEDPVRMFRAAVLGARLGFDLDPLVTEALAEHRRLIQSASPARLLEEYYKILRSGCAEASFRALGRCRLLELITPELADPPDALWDSLAALDRYRQKSEAPPPELTTTILVGSLLVPIGALHARHHRTSADDRQADRVGFGALPVARRDLERLRQVLQVAERLADPALPARVSRGITHRPAFADALVWLSIFGNDPELVDRWRHAHHQQRSAPSEPGSPELPPEGGHRRRRRRRRRRGPRPAP